MIVVRIELWSAVTGKVTQLGQMNIANDGTGEDNHMHYDGAVLRKPDFKAVTRDGRVTYWPRHSKTIWHLVAKMLLNMGYV